MHGGILRLDKHVSIDIDLTIEITGLPTNGDKPEKYLDEKTKEKTLAEEMKKTYGRVRGFKGIVINRINEPMKRI